MTWGFLCVHNCNWISKSIIRVKFLYFYVDKRIFYYNIMKSYHLVKNSWDKKLWWSRGGNSYFKFKKDFLKKMKKYIVFESMKFLKIKNISFHPLYSTKLPKFSTYQIYMWSACIIPMSLILFVDHLSHRALECNAVACVHLL